MKRIISVLLFLSIFTVAFPQSVQQVGNTSNFKIALGTPLTMGHTNEPIVIFADSSQNFKASVIKFDGNSWNYVGQPGFSSYPLISVSSYTQTVSPYQTFQYTNSFSTNCKLISDGNSGYYVGVLEYGTGSCSVYHFDGINWQSVFNEPSDNYWGTVYSVDIAINNNLDLIVGFTKRYSGSNYQSKIELKNISNPNMAWPAVFSSQYLDGTPNNLKILIKDSIIKYGYLGGNILKRSIFVLI